MLKNPPSQPDQPFACLSRYKAENRDPAPLLAIAEQSMKRIPEPHRRIDFVCALNLAAETLLTQELTIEERLFLCAIPFDQRL